MGYFVNFCKLRVKCHTYGISGLLQPASHGRGSCILRPKAVSGEQTPEAGGACRMDARTESIRQSAGGESRFCLGFCMGFSKYRILGKYLVLSEGMDLSNNSIWVWANTYMVWHSSKLLSNRKPDICPKPRDLSETKHFPKPIINQNHIFSKSTWFVQIT